MVSAAEEKILLQHLLSTAGTQPLQYLEDLGLFVITDPEKRKQLQNRLYYLRKLQEEKVQGFNKTLLKHKLNLELSDSSSDEDKEETQKRKRPGGREQNKTPQKTAPIKKTVRINSLKTDFASLSMSNSGQPHPIYVDIDNPFSAKNKPFVIAAASNIPGKKRH